MKNVGIAMPVANEADTIKDFLLGLLEKLEPLDYNFCVYVVMDSFSKDNTLEIVNQLAETNPAIKSLYFEQSTGVASCYLHGLKTALADDCDFIIEMDSGGSHPPEKIPEILNALDAEQYEVVFMSRFAKGGSMQGLPFYRTIVSRGGTLLANIWLGMNRSDATSGYEAFTAKTLSQLNLDAFISFGGIYQTEMKYYCKNFKIKELPFNYKASASSFKAKWIYIALKTLFKMKFNRKKVMRNK